MPFLCFQFTSPVIGQLANAQFCKTLIFSFICTFLLFGRKVRLCTMNVSSIYISMISFKCSRSDCHLTIISLINRIKIDHLLTVINDHDWQFGNYLLCGKLEIVIHALYWHHFELHVYCCNHTLHTLREEFIGKTVNKIV